MDLSSYNLVLGESWFRKANPRIDFCSGAIHVQDKNGYHNLCSQKPQHLIDQGHIETISHRAAAKICRTKNAEGFLYFVRKTHEAGPSNLPKNILKKFRKVIKRFQDRFRTELPDSLLPKRILQHRIDTRDAKPVNQNAFPLSPA